MTELGTFRQVNDQESSAYMNRSEDHPTVLIKRTSGDVSVGRLDKYTRDVHFSENGQELTKRIALENLTDARQEELAAELAGRALRGAVQLDSELAPQVNGTEVQAEIDPLDALNDDVRGEVLLYRRTVQNKVDSERAKDFAQAAEDGRAIYRFEQTLSPAAKAFLKLS
jgi:hypothetical protein